MRYYVETVRTKSEKSASVLLLSGILAGMFVALTGSAVINTLAHTTSDAAMRAT